MKLSTSSSKRIHYTGIVTALLPPLSMIIFILQDGIFSQETEIDTIFFQFMIGIFATLHNLVAILFIKNREYLLCMIAPNLLLSILFAFIALYAVPNGNSTSGIAILILAIAMPLIGFFWMALVGISLHFSKN